MSILKFLNNKFKEQLGDVVHEIHKFCGGPIFSVELMDGSWIRHCNKCGAIKTKGIKYNITVKEIDLDD